MSGLPRYLPLGEDVEYVVNATVTRTPVTVTRTPVAEALPPLGGSTLPFVIFGVLLGLLTLLIIVSTLYSYLHRGEGPITPRRYSPRLRQVLSELVEYLYPGIKAVLRRYYLRLRESLGCRTCTPREIAARVGSYADFAELYEEVVYGSKEVDPSRVRSVVSGDDI